MTTPGLPPIVDQQTWQREVDALRVREKAATRELDAIAAQRRRLPMVELPDYVLDGENGPVRLVDVFEGKRQLIVYHHMWSPGEEWQCPGCTGFTAQFTRLQFLDNYDARFVIVTHGPIDEALAYKRRVGNQMTWYSTANSPFGADVGVPSGSDFALNVFLRDGDRVYRTWCTTRRGVEQLGHVFGLLDVLPYGRQEEWQDSPAGWPQRPTYSGWSSSQEIAAAYGWRTAKTGLATISLVCMPTPEQDKAVAFYESLGFEKRTDLPFGDGFDHRWIEMYPPQGTTGIALAPPPPHGGPVQPVVTGITLTTGDIDATHQAMTELGVDVDAQVARLGEPVPPMFWFRDPSGHTLMVVQA